MGQRFLTIDFEFFAAAFVEGIGRCRISAEGFQLLYGRRPQARHAAPAPVARGAGYWLAGYLAETVGGKPYADVMQERVFGPVGMASSTLRPLMAMTRPLSQGHDLVSGHSAVQRPAPDNAANWPAGSVFSNLPDLSRFTIAMMNDGKLEGKQVLSPKVVTALTSPHAKAPGWETPYGYGLNVQQTGGVRVWMHGGARAGYGSFIALLPGSQAAVIVLCNRSGESLEKTHLKIMEMLGAPQLERETYEHRIMPRGVSF